jgi:MoxR-like ATPase
MEIVDLRAIRDGVREQVHRVVMGQEHVVDLILVGLLCQGHVLLEGVPGTAKTLLARTFAAITELDFNRIQFTPDLMPGDVIGTNLFNFQTNRFVLTKGAIFTQLLLADEINRTPPKTQAALLQAMQERSVTIDGKTHELGDAFMVIATQNPIEQEGTYPLPEAQLDRFLFKILVPYPGRDQERDMVRLHGHHTAMPRLEDFALEPVADLARLRRAREAIAAISLADEMVDYIVDIVRGTRQDQRLLCGASPRSANMLATAARVAAGLAGRDFVIPDDVKSLVVPALCHRLVMAPAAEIEGHTAETVLREIVDRTPAPR